MSDKPDDEGGQGDSKVIGDKDIVVSVVDGENVIQETMEGIENTDHNLKTSGSEIQFDIDIDDVKGQDTNNLTLEPENVIYNEKKVDNSRVKVDPQFTSDNHDFKNHDTRTEITGNVETKSKEQNIDNLSADLPMKKSELTSENGKQLDDVENVFVDSVNEKSSMTLNVKDNSRPTSREGSRSRHSSATDVLSPIIVTSELLNEPIGDSETTLLMIASKEGHRKLIQMLMKAGSNPAIK